MIAPPKAPVPRRLRSSAAILILANAIPLFGAIVLRWDIFTIMLLFWLENVVIGLYAILRILFSGGIHPLAGCAFKAFLVPFFVFHYGMFTLVHGVFVVQLFGGGLLRPDKDSLFGSTPLQYLPEMPHLLVPLAAMVVSHGYSFVVNYIQGGERETTLPMAAMFQPYGRITVLHLTLLAGGFLAMMLGAHWAAVAVLVGLKTFLDLAAHLREHRPKNNRDGNVPPGGTHALAINRLATVLNQISAPRKESNASTLEDEQPSHGHRS